MTRQKETWVIIRLQTIKVGLMHFPQAAEMIQRIMHFQGFSHSGGTLPVPTTPQVFNLIPMN
jgi:hypothetical protein